jgi:hypothetical protein
MRWAIIERALVRWPLAAIKLAALTAAVSPAESIRDGDLGARICLALGATTMRPAEPTGLAAALAAVNDAGNRAAYGSGL